MKIKLLSILVCLLFCTTLSAYNGRHGWFTQKAPQKLIICNKEGLNQAEIMLLESLSGLCGQAVNDGTFNEMVWIEFTNTSYDEILKSSLKSLNITKPTRMDLWQLLDYLKKKKIIKGYILYKADTSKGENYSLRDGINYSSNVATVYAGLLKGILVEESLEKRIKESGLKKLKDARYESPETCFAHCKKQLNRSSALSIDPKVSNCRDIAIAQKLMLYYGTGTFSEQILEWVTPLSPIMGWNCGNEDEYTGAITRWGHYNTASNWCQNLPFIMAASDKTEPLTVHEKEFNDINFKDSSAFHSFVVSDGDNMQWTMGSFIDDPVYYGNKDENRSPVSWTLCPVNLSVVSTSTWNRFVSMKKDNSSVIEYGGGYQYPDEFAKNRPNREELLTEFARRMNWHFKKLNIKIFGFICKDVFSKEARQAYDIYAREIEGLTGMIAIQYNPYNMGGDMVWVKSKENIDIPVVTARFSIWSGLFDNSLCGGPDYVASLINRDAAKAEKQKEEYPLSWTIIHAWSDFSKTSSSTNLPIKGYNASKTSDLLLSPQVKNVSLNELLWRIRARH
ncbi:GxGYxYP domain-containing protein [Bacteroides sp.]|uniref:GxGYxYP domain-containing protein n=1 Tax=Bacteroides sp. TaxID=29523 RepID=UPI00262D5039|nr:GxGYxYP domain-containing protein [Bacteroides sp.]MDD3036560.1 GxGYxYP family putative glycoside hydrolase [Bacteroides sp.]